MTSTMTYSSSPSLTIRLIAVPLMVVFSSPSLTNLPPETYKPLLTAPPFLEGDFSSFWHFIGSYGTYVLPFLPPFSTAMNPSEIDRKSEPCLFFLYSLVLFAPGF